MKGLSLNVPAMSRVTVTMQYIVSNKTRATLSRTMSQTDDNASALPVDGYTVCKERMPVGGSWVVGDIAAQLRKIGDEMNADYTFINTAICRCDSAGTAVERILKMVPFLKYVSETLEGHL